MSFPVQAQPLQPQPLQPQPSQAMPAQGQPPHLQPVPAQPAQTEQALVQQTPSQALPQASSSLNIAIQDSKDFPSDLAQAQELYSEFAMADGRVLFECPNLVKANGIDLMNCPLSVILRLRVLRRTPHGAVVLWHIVLPLPVISKYLLNPPHEWETWIGLFPNTQSLDAHTPDTMFTQAVHLISRPDFPKLRLRFTYHNPELQAQISAQCEMQQQESRRRVERTQQVGRQQFEEIHKLTRGLRGSGDNGPVDRDAGLGSIAAATTQPQPSDLMVAGSWGDTASRGDTEQPATPATPPRQAVAAVASAHPAPGSPCAASEEALREAFASALTFVNSVQQVLARSPRRSLGAPHLPPTLSYDEVLASKAPGPILDAHCMQLHQCLCSIAYADGPAKGAAIASEAQPLGARAEHLLTDGLRMALMGMLEDGDAASVPQAATASTEQLLAIQSSYPSLWEAYREVSSIARERAGLIEQVGSLGRDRAALLQQRRLQDPGPPLPPEAAAQLAELEELRRLLQEREAELGQLRACLGEPAQPRGASGASPGGRRD